jgi:glutathione S-transferase
MSNPPTITGFVWVPEFARGFVRELRARWALEEEGQPYQVDLIDFDRAKSEAHRYYQPFGQIPTYRDDEVEIFESGAIAIRIAERGGTLLPSEVQARASAIQWVIAALNSVEPQVMQLAIVDIFEKDKPWSAMRRHAVIADIKARLADLEQCLGDKTWLDGETFTVGDLIMIHVLRSAEEDGILADFPKLAAYVARGTARPAYQRALADHMAVYADAKAA